MRKRDRQPPAPPERVQTVPRQIIECLRDGPVSLRTLSTRIGLSEKQLAGHLDNLHKQVRVTIIPARCAKCGFEYRDRRRSRKPGKCPKCRSTHIQEPLYSIEA